MSPLWKRTAQLRQKHKCPQMHAHTQRVSESYFSNVVVMKKACAWVCLCCRTWILTCGIPTRIWFRSHSRVWSSIESGGRKFDILKHTFHSFIDACFFSNNKYVKQNTFSLIPHSRQEMMSLLHKEAEPNPSLTALTEGPRSSRMVMIVKRHSN